MDIGKKIGLAYGPPTRNAFGEALRELGRGHPNIVVIDGDVGNSTRTAYFGAEFPERFFNFGIAESNLVGVASGLAAAGKEALVASFACFLLCNAYDQIRMGVAFPRLNVKLVGSHSGISIGEDGPSQMGIEDIFPSWIWSSAAICSSICSATSTVRSMRSFTMPSSPTAISFWVRRKRPTIAISFDRSTKRAASISARALAAATRACPPCR
ncbi:MAG: hypothetical protein R3A44_31615 [Caldilineaceae bacterium]